MSARMLGLSSEAVACCLTFRVLRPALGLLCVMVAVCLVMGMVWLLNFHLVLHVARKDFLACALL
eukprot:6238409-Pyramimonas_sp.AAC.1